MLLKKYLYITAFILIAGNSYSVLAQSTLVKAKLDSTAIEIGDQIYLSLTIEKSGNDMVYFPPIKDTIVKGLEVIEILPADTQFLKNSKQLISKKYLVSSFEAGLISIPAFAFIKAGDTLYTNSLELKINPVKLDSTEIAKIDTSQVLDIFDIKGPIDTPWTFKEFIQLFYPYILGIIVLTLIIAIIIFYLKKRAQNKPLIKLPEKPKDPAHIIAIRALDLLKSKKLWQSGFEKEYYLELTDIIRQYIEDRFGVHTFERTSQEILYSIDILRILEKQVFDQLRNLLTLADLAKFAKYKPLPNENDLSMKNAYLFIENTKAEDKIKDAEIKDDVHADSIMITDKSIDSQKG